MKAFLWIVAALCAASVAEAQNKPSSDAATASDGGTDAHEVRRKFDEAAGELVDQTFTATFKGNQFEKLGHNSTILWDNGDKADKSTILWDNGDKADKRVPPRLSIEAMDKGTGETDDGRKQRLKSVVRVLAGSKPDSPLLCTGTAVVWDGEPGLLTAAHCMYETGPNEEIGPGLRKLIYVAGVGAIPAEAARLHPSFRGCIGLPYETCVTSGAPDVAFIPIKVQSPWKICTKRTPTPKVVGFGFGKDATRRDLPTELLKGELELDGTTRGALWVSTSPRQQQVNVGDSGGPVITFPDDELLAARDPAVCFIASARRAKTSLLQPVWTYTSKLEMRASP